jgi:hypothetical protein
MPIFQCSRCSTICEGNHIWYTCNKDTTSFPMFCDLIKVNDITEETKKNFKDVHLLL